MQSKERCKIKPEYIFKMFDAGILLKKANMLVQSLATAISLRFSFCI